MSPHNPRHVPNDELTVREYGVIDARLTVVRIEALGEQRSQHDASDEVKREGRDQAGNFTFGALNNKTKAM